MKILGIDTSCDDTAVAVVKANKEISILSDVVSSQTKIHRKWGGVYPALAKREHEKNLVPVLKESLERAGLLKKSKGGKAPLKSFLQREEVLRENLEVFLENYSKPDLDFIAVTQGPGLEPCLWTGINFAKTLSRYWNMPLIPVNHLKAHILSSFKSKEEASFPAVCLIASGGHTQIILMRSFKDYSLIGETRDDAAGECFDKTARILGLEYPGGPEIAKIAKKSSGISKMPRPMINQKNYDFSFSGLKTAVLYNYRKQKKKSKKYIQGMAFEIQEAITDVLVKKTVKAAKDKKAKSIILGGGVTANKKLRRKFKDKVWKEIPSVKLLIPPENQCTDNGSMIAIAASFDLRKKTKDFEAEANLAI